jgi:stage II sporulation protein P
MKHFTITILTLLAVLLAAAPAAYSENDGDCIYYLHSTDGEYLTMRAGKMYEGDEYIAGDNRHFRITKVDDAACVAYAQPVENESVFSGVSLSEAALAEEAEKSGKSRKSDSGNHLICMYSTHSDESYVPSDGDSSLWEDAGIYDVGNALKEALEKKGMKVIYSEETFLPHDTGAYSRSASTAKNLLQKSPDALFDVHRDAVPAEEYETEVDGEEMSKVRLFVGRSNANSQANMAFAKEIKAQADEMYPGLVKDIFIGKGNYNQELYPQALLLELGTHEIDKELVINSTDYLADVVDNVLYGETAQAEEGKKAENTGASKGIIWAIVIAILAAVIYALASTGRLGGMWDRIKRSISELTGGSIGGKK